MRNFFLVIFIFCNYFLFSEEIPPYFCEEKVYAFKGKHYFASFYDCNESAIKDSYSLPKIMEEAVLAAHANIINSVVHYFSPDGMTMVLLLEESHASIHTYPEHRACFIDLFTCGESCDHEAFVKVLCKYLNPQKVNDTYFIRE